MATTMQVRKVISCSRCGHDHVEIKAEKLERPFAPPEAGGVRWTHWAPCSTNGQPIMFAMVNAPDVVDDASPGTKRN